ncbi:uncharacterized protein B0I36DRAFT_321326 [Microdochium trichocladiopsis]|uniref:Mmc1 C-terminal domain-containing protein n=1 Tax=Microdochium trichocladiopsis TaxID=1682393 RepID=A0A9P9BPQ8_9PEZI|nr:uncharacterized protein B0I36DRAFT_321326 [Microdochium trichocladiopsis]KAH7033384.1 hypothetical protein B0I36DRAFT_321326 [Microdochium trichocladiopsis]
MPPRLSPRPFARSKALVRQLPTDSPSKPSVCLFCSISATPTPFSRQPKQKRPIHGPASSTAAAAAAAVSAASPGPDAATPSTDPRRDLQDALLELQKHAANYVNLSRVQLAVNGLRQAPGDEAIRVAVLGMSSASESAATTKTVARLLLADPLKDREAWEDEIDQHNLSQPMLIRVGPKQPQAPGTISISRNDLLHEVHVSSALFNGHNLELMIMESNPLTPGQQSTAAVSEFEESVLVPIIDIPTSSTGRYTAVTTPVHAAIVVANGIMGAASVAALASTGTEDVIIAAVNLPDYKPSADQALPFTPIDAESASLAVDLIRKDIGKAVEYEHLWSQSNLSQLNDWLKNSTGATEDGTTKAPVRSLIVSILSNASAALQSEELRTLSTVPGNSTTGSVNTKLQRQLDDWAQDAHKELQDELDMAFASRRWRKLGWWKLFWRVDDVAHLTTDILNQRFLPNAERNAIFLAGRMTEAGAPLNPSLLPASHETGDNGSSKPEATALATVRPSWPLNIPASRNYLQTETIPALQSLAQKLVVQTLSTSSLTGALGALVYVGTLTTSIYEAGAVAALGVVWSLRRLQTKWEAARDFWEGEVREEGRKAVRGVERVMTSAIRGGGGSSSSAPGVGQLSEDETQRRKAKLLIQKAQDALDRLK